MACTISYYTYTYDGKPAVKRILYCEDKPPKFLNLHNSRDVLRKEGVQYDLFKEIKLW